MVRPYTVLLMLPSDWRQDQPSASDEVTRVWVEAVDGDQAEALAYEKLPEQFPDEPEINFGDFATVAIYPGRLFDEFEP